MSLKIVQRSSKSAYTITVEILKHYDGVQSCVLRKLKNWRSFKIA